MRFPLAIAACVGLAVVAMTSGQASAQSQETYESASRMLDLRGDNAVQQGSGLRVLRGSAASSRASAAPRRDRILGPGRYQAVAGERFWMVDQETGRLVSCRNRGTANVGERKIGCVFGSFSRYGRNFGDNFRH